MEKRIRAAEKILWKDLPKPMIIEMLEEEPAAVLQDKLYQIGIPGEGSENYLEVNDRKYPLIELESLTFLEESYKERHSDEISKWVERNVEEEIRKYLGELRKKEEEKDPLLEFIVDEVFPHLIQDLSKVNLSYFKRLREEREKKLRKFIQKKTEKKRRRSSIFFESLKLPRDFPGIVVLGTKRKHSFALKPTSFSVRSFMPTLFFEGKVYELAYFLPLQNLSSLYMNALKKEFLNEAVKKKEEALAKIKEEEKKLTLKEKIRMLNLNAQGIGYRKISKNCYEIYVKTPNKYVLYNFEDGKYYLFNGTKVSMRITMRGGRITAERPSVHRGYKHPFVFSDGRICPGPAGLPIDKKHHLSGKDIAESLQIAKNVLLYGLREDEDIVPAHPIQYHPEDYREITPEEMRRRGLRALNL